jgi:hypothetical protein
MPAIHPAPFLRQALLADAVTTAACALLMLLAAGPLEALLGLPAGLLRAAGAILIAFAVLVGTLALRNGVSPLAVWAVIVANALWAADSLVLLVSGWIQPTPAGMAFVVAQAAVVAMYAELQFVGLKRSNAALTPAP